MCSACGHSGPSCSASRRSGRALRRQSYDLNEENLFDVEYADVLGIPFDFTAEPVVVPAKLPKETVRVQAMRPERDGLEIRFPRVTGYRVEPPNDRLEAEFNEDHVLELKPELVGSAEVLNSGIVGEAVELNLRHREGTRRNKVLYTWSSTSSTASGGTPARLRRSTSSDSSSGSRRSGWTPAWSVAAGRTRRSCSTGSWPAGPATGSWPRSSGPRRTTGS